MFFNLSKGKKDILYLYAQQCKRHQNTFFHGDLKEAGSRSEERQTNIGRIESFLFFQRGWVYSQALNFQAAVKYVVGSGCQPAREMDERQVKSTRHSKSDFALTMYLQHQGIELKGYKKLKTRHKMTTSSDSEHKWVLVFVPVFYRPMFMHILVSLPKTRSS